METFDTAEPDAFARVCLLGTAEGGRRTPIANRYKCSVFFDEQRDVAHDCMLVLSSGESIAPGGEAKLVGIRFLDSVMVRPKLHPGLQLVMWEGKTIGSMEILETRGDRETEAR